jgi:hypothetical protein
MTFEKSDAFFCALKAYYDTLWKDPRKALDMSDLSRQSLAQYSTGNPAYSVALHTLEHVLDKTVKRIEGMPVQ